MEDYKKSRFFYEDKNYWEVRKIYKEIYNKFLFSCPATVDLPIKPIPLTRGKLIDRIIFLGAILDLNEIIKKLEEQLSKTQAINA